MAFGGDISVPAGEQADVVFVANGDADIAGTVNTLTVIDGNATLHGATVETIVIVSGTLALEEGTTVLGNVRSIESTVTQAEGVDIAGDIKGIDAELIALGAFLGPALLLFAIGLLLASLVAGLLLVGGGHPPGARGRTGDRHRTPEGLRDRPVRRDRRSRSWRSWPS